MAALLANTNANLLCALMLLPVSVYSVRLECKSQMARFRISTLPFTGLVTGSTRHKMNHCLPQIKLCM